MESISQTVSHFASAIEFSEADFVLAKAMSRDMAHASCLGLPPDDLKAVHTPALVNAWEAKLRRCFSQPVEVEQGDDYRRVQVLGSAILDFEQDGTVSAYVWAFEDGELPTPVRVVDVSVVARDVPYRTYWMNGIRAGAVQWLKRRHPEQHDLCVAYAAWVHDGLVRRCWDASDQARVRQRIATALALDPFSLQIASQVQLGPHPMEPVRLNAYNHVVTYRADYQDLWKEAPNLIPLYALLAEDIQTQPGNRAEVTERMRCYLMHRCGLRPSFWRLLCREGTAWIQPFLAFYDFDQAPSAQVVADLLSVAQAFGTDSLVPPWLLHGLMSVGGNPNRPDIDYRHRLHDLFVLCRRLGLLAERADESELALLKANAHEIFDWALDHLTSMSDSSVRRLSVAGVIRRVRLQQETDRLQASQEKPWNVPFKLEPPCAGIQAVILDSALAVWQEGQNMRHCAATYIDACGRVEMVMVSFRLDSGGRGLATATFSMTTPEVTLNRISGYANTLVDPEIVRCAQDCARQLQRQVDEIRQMKADAP